MEHSEPATGGGSSTTGLVDADVVFPLRRRRPWRWVAAGVAVVAVMGFTIVAWNRFGTDATLVRSPLIGKPAPEFSLPALDGEGATLGSADLTGRPYVVNFWASWCVPCREEAPALESFYRTWSSRGVGMVGIVYSDSPDEARSFRDEFGLTYPQVTDPGGVAAIDFGVFGIPETYVVDERGIVMAKLVGAVSPGTLDEVLARVMAGEIYTSENDQYRTSPDG